VPASYPVVYHDRSGEERTTIENDGRVLRMMLRGVEFAGCFWDDWTPAYGTTADRVATFTLWDGTLAGYVLDCELPLPVMQAGTESSGTLHVHFEMDVPESDCPVADCRLLLQLDWSGATYPSSGHSTDFESALNEVQAVLPAHTYLRTCTTCAFSDYYPGGQPLFAALACFRGNKAGYRKVKNRWDLFRIWDTRTEQVQEIHVCPEFERRTPGTGHRG
jgi:hypothetical protein